MALYDLGLAVVPTPEHDGKSPKGAVKNFGGWRCRLPPNQTEALFRRHPSANIAILPHLCRPRLAVVDCDDDAALAVAEERYGWTPLMVRTPRGDGGHLYYQAPASEVRQQNLRITERLPIDIKAGSGAVVVVPPSIRPSSGRPYLFARGDWSLLPELPVFPIFGLAHDERRLPEQDGSATGRAGVPVGRRNKHLFSELLRLAPDCEGPGELAMKAHLVNERDCSQPLFWDEVERTAASAWSYQEAGRNYVGRGRYVRVPEEEFLALSDSPDALMLLMKLRYEHEGRHASFAASPKGMAKGGVLPGWSDKRYRKALAVLKDRGFLELLRKGGSRVGDHDLYAFAEKGAGLAPNTNKTPPPFKEGIEGERLPGRRAA